MSKSFIVGVIIFSLLVVIGSYFLVSGGKQNSTSVKLVSYQLKDKEKQKSITKHLRCSFIRIKDIE